MRRGVIKRSIKKERKIGEQEVKKGYYERRARQDSKERKDKKR